MTLGRSADERDERALLQLPFASKVTWQHLLANIIVEPTKILNSITLHKAMEDTGTVKLVSSAVRRRSFQIRHDWGHSFFGDGGDGNGRLPDFRNLL